MARQRTGRSLVEEVYDALRADILFGRRLPSSRLPINEIAEEHGVSVSVVREAVTRLASEDLVEATPQRGFRVRPISIEHFRDLTWVRIQIETMALRQSISRGDIAWEADLVAAHHRLAVTPTYLEDGTGNTDEVVLRVDESHLQVLDSDLLVTELTGHLLAREDALRVHRTDGTDLAGVALTTVRLALAVEVVAADGPGPTLTFGETSDVDSVPNFKNVGRDFLADFEVFT